MRVADINRGGSWFLCPPAPPRQPQTLHRGHFGGFYTISWVCSGLGALSLLFREDQEILGTAHTKQSQSGTSHRIFSPLCPQLIKPKCLCHLSSSSIKTLVPGKGIQVKSEGGCGLLGNGQDGNRERKQTPQVL